MRVIVTVVLALREEEAEEEGEDVRDGTISQRPGVEAGTAGLKSGTA